MLPALHKKGSDRATGERRAESATRWGFLRPLVVLASTVTAAAALQAADWPQYRGLARNGATAEPIATTWPGTQPAVLWRAKVGRGHSPVSVAQGKLVTLGYSSGTDTVWCLDAVTGKEIWRFDYPALGRLKDEPGNGAFDGPHAAPAIAGGRVYTLSRDGQVHCLDLAGGKLIWRRHLHKECNAVMPECGFAGSPLLLSGCVIVSVGPAGTALDAATGATKWDSGPEMAGYGAPTLHTDEQGRKWLLFFGADKLVAVDPSDGKRLWSFPWPTKWGTNVADPVVVNAAVLLSSAYDRGCASVNLADGGLRWQSMVLGSHCSPMILYQGNVYGFDGYINVPETNALVCMDPLTGAERWRKKGLAGQMILAGDKLVLLSVRGELIIVKPAPGGYQELIRVRIQPPEECPVPPTLVDGRLYCRTGRGMVMCLDVAPRK